MDAGGLTIALAGLGAVASLAASLGRSRGRLGETAAGRLNLAGYGFGGLSLALFVLRGLLA